MKSNVLQVLRSLLLKGEQDTMLPALADLTVSIASQLVWLSSHQKAISQQQQQEFQAVQVNIKSARTETMATTIIMSDGTTRNKADLMRITRTWIQQHCLVIPWMPLLGPEFRNAVMAR